ncbi:hypothetical protein GobsT_60390 [Gemmata obscuriglobus]|uniref:Uncharacterized protein n=1 Tax=Gemmata obscuriglobus TaxID=114 RepID=A0A2Z3GS77_9BACT|nr:hypothetical protein [Gemmata obscuriglobus]AWM36188.1 hypothetical protein C1280_03625 [Gemmata obscuriglobus]QEG31218.1 hypothetical protein GobsT_60390 [Gemmata obscuriglobus]VTS10556.1 Uncharacterized protein OS=Singulisphaera acidiphila (strain ATCC BAA-1392 / DSM 18658 / VKM B-2454 / MOB10) GN=Sinac_1679 PE=4 SV=1 [Gemmata obscuriglobus UQM 2246]
MTEAEWLVATDPMALLRHLGAEQAGRKYLLYLVAACRHITHLFHAPASVEAVGIAERYADGAADGEEMAGANGIAESPTFGFDFDADFYEQYPTQRTNLPRLVEMGALGESVLTGGEWRVNEPVCKRLAAAAELAYLTTLRPELNRGHLKRVE